MGNKEINVFNKEDAYDSLEIINSWIYNIDAKISFALVFIGVLIDCISNANFQRVYISILNNSSVLELSRDEIISIVLVSALYFAEFLTLCCLMIALYARLKNPNGVESVFYFRSIVMMKLKEYMKKTDSISEGEIIKELQEQIHTNSKICTRKAQWFNRGIIHLMLTVVLWFICIVFVRV